MFSVYQSKIRMWILDAGPTHFAAPIAKTPAGTDGAANRIGVLSRGRIQLTFKPEDREARFGSWRMIPMTPIRKTISVSGVSLRSSRYFLDDSETLEFILVINLSPERMPLTFYSGAASDGPSGQA